MAEFDIEITVHDKKQLKILIDRMIENETLKFLFSDVELIRKESSTKKPVHEYLSNFKNHPTNACIGLSFFKQGYILGIIVDPKYRQRVQNFLRSIKISEKTNDTPLYYQEKSKNKINIFIKSLDKEKAEELKKILLDKGILDLNERPYYEMDPKY